MVDFTPDAQQSSAAPTSQQPHIDFTPDPVLPKMPDTSGVQKMAQDNLAAHDNQEVPEGGEPKPPLTPAERLNTAAGFPVDKVVNGQAKPTDFNQEHRTQYVNGLNDGSWTNSGDAITTQLHAISPISAGLDPERYNFLYNVGKTESDFLKDLHPADKIDTNQNYIAQLGQAASPYLATIALPFSSLFSIGGAAAQQIWKQSIEPEDWEKMPEEEKQKGFNVMNAVGQGVAGIAAAGTPLGHPTVARSVLHGEILPPETPPIEGEPLQIGGQVMKDVTPSAGHWDNHPGSEPIIEHVAKQLGKEPSEVTTPEVDHALAQGGKDLMPAGKDFTAVAGVTGIPEAGLKNIFQLAGITPEQVFLANQKDKTVGEQVGRNEVPDQWKHLVPEQPAKTEAAAPVPASLEPSYHFDTDSYGVKNEHGEFVKTGFGSQEEAHDYIEHQAERAAIEGEPETAQAVTTYERPADLEKTSTAEQAVIPGAEKAGAGVMAQRGTEAPLKGGNAPLEGGLFDVAGRGQGDLLEQKSIAKPQGIVAPSAIGKVTSLRGFLSQENLKAKFNEGNELVSIVKDGNVVKGDVALDYAHELAKEYGYMPKDLPDRPAAYASDLANLLKETDGGREATRDADAGRVAKAKETAEIAKQKDPDYIAKQAHAADINSDKLEGESDKQWLKRMTDALRDYHTSIVEPTIEAVHNMWGDESGAVPSNVLTEVRNTIAPTMAGKNAQQAAIVLRNAYGVARRERAKDEATLSTVARIAAKMDDAGRRDFYRYVEGRSTGEALNDKALQPLADSVRAVYQRMRGQLEAMPETRMMNFVRDYFTHQWADPKAAAKFTNDFIAAQGSGRSLKKRTLPTIADGLAAGLELKEPNPVRAVSAYLGSMSNYIASVNGLRSIVHDLGAEYYAKGMQPEEYQPLVGKNAERIENARVDPVSGKMIPARNMQLYAPKEVAMIYNRFYSKGFEDTGLKSTYELARDAINANTMFELGLSTYHLGTINIQSLNQDIGRILKNTVVGDWKGVMDATKKLLTPGLHYMQGRKLVQQYNGLKDHGINMEAMAEHFAKANLRIGNDPLSVISKKGFVHGAMRGELPEIIDHLKQQALSGYGTGLVKSGVEVAARAVSDVSAPIFQHYIPAIKMSSFSDLMSDWLRQNPKASDAEIAAAQARIGNLIDDRFGEMNMENVFWHKMMKQITGLVFRAPGWDLGLIRQVGGAAKDFYSTLEGVVKGEKFNPDLLDRQLYMIAAAGLYAATNSALTYLYTGVPPTEQELADFIAYRTGGMRKQFGKWFPERGVLPGHGRELVNMYPLPGQGIVSGLTEEVKNKTNTLPKSIWEDITNHDWRQKDIYDPASKSWIQRTPGVAQGEHILEGFKPFMIDGMMKNEKDEGTNISLFARALGVRPAGTRITDRADLEKLLDKKK